MNSFIDEAGRHKISGINCRARELNLARPLVAVLPVRTGFGVYRRPRLGVFEPELTGDDCDPSKGSGDGRLHARAKSENFTFARQMPN